MRLAAVAHRIGKQLTLALLLCAGAFFALPSFAIVNIGDDVELEGYLKLQNAFRENKFLEPELIMQRNTAQIEGKYYFLRDSTAFGRFSTGKLEEATLSVIARGAYDSVFDLRPRYSDPNDSRSESNIREAFVDMVLPPFTLRLGLQQVVWGETDNFRALDIINPLDLRRHWTLESWEDIRIPLWMARGIYDIGKIGPLEESFLEVVWIPDDFEPTRIETDPRMPWAFYGAGEPVAPNTAIIGTGIYDLDVELRDLRPDGWQGGMRFKGIWGAIDFSLNYFHGYSASPGSRVRTDLTRVDSGGLHTVIERVYPRTDVFGVTANYTDDRYTHSVFRLEATLTKGVPMAVAAAADPDGFRTIHQSVVMLAIDRPTWIRPLNRLRTFFITTQLFWRRHLDYSQHFLGIPAVVAAEIDDVPLPGRYVTDFPNRRDRDEFVATFAMSTTYGRAGQWKPQFAFALDPRSGGAYNQFAIEYLWSNHVVLELKQHLYWRAGGHGQGPWNVGDLWSRPGDRRNETVLSVIFQF